MPNEETPTSKSLPSAKAALTLTSAVDHLRLALDLIDQSGEDVAAAQLQLVIDAIAA